IRKDFRRGLPEGWSDLEFVKILEDQNSAYHPYGPLALPSLSRKLGIYYTNPQVVYLPHQKALEGYNDYFNEELYLLEERPDGGWPDYEPFGFSKEIIGYQDVLEDLREKKDRI